ncbi:LOW QUALITY PROTEIN: protein HGH1 homolog, partial [Anomalospiza imberbis]|uniref:LOW QUALITY PROTEIN: protein HGH1 homolog n=1 Tax=Anomalospiza imberbis TaxID=187417 RepID=UPI00358E04F7
SAWGLFPVGGRGRERRDEIPKIPEFPENHERLLSPEVDVLPFLLLPLAGPEELPEEEMEQLPVDLQYLPPEHRREEEPDIRKMLLETLMLLAATKRGRLHLRSRGSYLVLRELHAWEKDPEVLSTCQKLIPVSGRPHQVLIGDEPEAGMENLLEVTIPEELEQRLSDLDREEEEQWRKERQPEGTETPG